MQMPGDRERPHRWDEEGGLGEDGACRLANVDGHGPGDEVGEAVVVGVPVGDDEAEQGPSPSAQSPGTSGSNSLWRTAC